MKLNNWTTIPVSRRNRQKLMKLKKQWKNRNVNDVLSWLLNNLKITEIVNKDDNVLYDGAKIKLLREPIGYENCFPPYIIRRALKDDDKDR